MSSIKICFIGNDGGERDTYDGQTLKIRLYKRVLDDEGIPYRFINLYHWKKHLLSVISNIKKAVNECDSIFLMAGANGCRKILPIINSFNRRKKKKISVSMIGRGALAISLDKKGVDSDKFFLQNEYRNFQDKTTKRNLSKVSAVILETDVLTNTYRRFFGLDNCITIYNFRKSIKGIVPRPASARGLKLVYLSRVRSDKGVFDAMAAVSELPIELDVTLDIYGNIEMNGDEKQDFDQRLGQRIHYKGELANSEVIPTLALYDYFVFPTRCSEGMPGVLIEALLAGTPVISTRFTQSKAILDEGKDSLLYGVGCVNELKGILCDLLEHKEKRLDMSKNAINNSKKYSYESNRDILFSTLGIKEWKK